MGITGRNKIFPLPGAAGKDTIVSFLTSFFLSIAGRAAALAVSAAEKRPLLFIAVAIILIYSNTFQVPFILDDEPNILYNAGIRITELTPDSLLHAAFASTTRHRPLANLSFALNYYLHGYDPPGYHAINILIHIATAILLYLFLKTTLGLPSLRRHFNHPAWLPLVVTLIWSLHPIQTQSVTYIVQRMNSLAAMFYLLSLLCYVQARSATPSRRKWLLFGASLLSGLFALGAKENAATLPFFILLYEWYFFQNLSRKWLKHRIPYLAGALLILTGLAYIYLGGQPLQAIQSGYLSRPFTMDERLLTEFRVVLFYISLLLFPHPSRLNLDHDIALSTSWLAPASTIPAVAAIGGLAVLAVCLARHRPLYSFCLLWFLGNLLIESSIIGLEISFEHRNYLPSMLAILPIVAITGQGLQNKGLQGAALVMAVAAMAFWTHERNKVWGDELSLWSDAAGKSPQKARPQNNLGTAMFHKGRYKEAIVSYSRTLEIEPEHAIAHNNLGFLLDEFGRIREAIHHYLQAIRIQPDYRQAHLNLGKTIKNLPGGNPERIEPVPSDPVESLLARGTIMADLDSPEEALAFFTQALAINPDHAEAHFQKGTVLANQDKIDAAIIHFTAAVRLNPTDVDARFNLASALAGRHRFKEAISHFVEVLRLNPDDADARRNLEILRRANISS